MVVNDEILKRITLLNIATVFLHKNIFSSKGILVMIYSNTIVFNYEIMIDSVAW
jgi:hypothetical protein